MTLFPEGRPTFSPPRQTEEDRLRGLLTLWLNLAPVELRTLVPLPRPHGNGKSLAELTREAFDRADAR